MTKKDFAEWDIFAKCFSGAWGLDVTDEWGQVVPMLQFVPIISPKCYKLPQ